VASLVCPQPETLVCHRCRPASRRPTSAPPLFVAAAPPQTLCHHPLLRRRPTRAPPCPRLTLAVWFGSPAWLLDPCVSVCSTWRPLLPAQGPGPPRRQPRLLWSLCSVSLSLWCGGDVALLVVAVVAYVWGMRMLQRCCCADYFIFDAGGTVM
jgi:hypothetical protein